MTSLRKGYISVVLVAFMLICVGCKSRGTIGSNPTSAWEKSVEIFEQEFGFKFTGDELFSKFDYASHPLPLPGGASDGTAMFVAKLSAESMQSIFLQAKDAQWNAFSPEGEFVDTLKMFSSTWPNQWNPLSVTQGHYLLRDHDSNNTIPLTERTNFNLSYVLLDTERLMLFFIRIDT
jgi:hypothetical protein